MFLVQAHNHLRVRVAQPVDQRVVQTPETGPRYKRNELKTKILQNLCDSITAPRTELGCGVTRLRALKAGKASVRA